SRKLSDSWMGRLYHLRRLRARVPGGQITETASGSRASCPPSTSTSIWETAARQAVRSRSGGPNRRLPRAYSARARRADRSVPGAGEAVERGDDAEPPVVLVTAGNAADPGAGLAVVLEHALGSPLPVGLLEQAAGVALGRPAARGQLVLAGLDAPQRQLQQPA